LKFWRLIPIAELAGEITSLESRLRHLRESLVDVDATLQLFDPKADPTKTPRQAAYKRVSSSGQGSSTGSSSGL
jgi:superfamily II helicase